MKKSILVGALVVSVLSIGAYAHGGDGDNDGNMMGNGGMMGNGNSQGMMRSNGQGYNNQKMMGRGGFNGHHRGGSFSGMMGGQQGGMMGGNAGMFANLKLSDEQSYKISILRDEMHLEMRKFMGPNAHGMMSGFIGENGFDKEGFVKKSDDIHEKMSKIMSENMEKMFNVLTKEQRTQLKSNLEQ